MTDGSEFAASGKNQKLANKCLLDMLDLLQSYHYTSGGAVEVTWQYDEEDEDMLESGKELAEGLDLKFFFVAYSA
jgi:hypothetical protein